MQVKKNGVFNLINTNGRRADIVNALTIYLEILNDLDKEYPTESWQAYPKSIKQLLFYTEAITRSSDILKQHGPYDEFYEAIKNEYHLVLDKNQDWINREFNKYKKIMDNGIEDRARHYTSSLVNLGLANNNRKITEIGYMLMKGEVDRDGIEELLPLDDVNIIILRQLAKLRIFTNKNEKGERAYYSPFLLAIKLLKENDGMEKNDFISIIQNVTPYLNEKYKWKIANEIGNVQHIKKILNKNILENLITPEELKIETLVDKDTFVKYFKNKKSKNMVDQYYEFYEKLYNFVNHCNIENYNELKEIYLKNEKIIDRAFGQGEKTFNFKKHGIELDLETFIVKNSSNLLLQKLKLNNNIYNIFTYSKHLDQVSEYSDATIRLLSASGLFRFKNLVELSFKDLILMIFDNEIITENIFGVMTDDEYLKYEINEDSTFNKSISIKEIYNLDDHKIFRYQKEIINQYNAKSLEEAKKEIKEQKNNDFTTHIQSKYTREKVMQLLPLFSDRKNDKKIQNQVNDLAAVPTIYEFIIAIAWYYISGEDYDLYESMNLSLNGDFEPVVHAGGGNGDIIINYNDTIVMLEVTMMNKNAQKRGEWEPVLRHSLNLKAENQDKETITFFIADELDTNTINIWRAVAAVPLESTIKHKEVEGIMIMPFTNKEILNFLENNTTKKNIIDETKKSFDTVPKITDMEWRENVISKLARG